jgi:hypothetical protein
MKTSIVVLVLLLSACGSKEVERESARKLAIQVPPALAMAPPVMKEVFSYAPSDNEPESETSGDLIMKRADVRFQVENVETNTKNIEKLVSAHKGLVSRQNLSTATEQISNEITIRVPSSAFVSLLDDLAKESKFVDYKRIASENVTEEYEDIQTRLKTKKEVRDRYIDILKTKAKTVEDILKAEEHIRVLQEEIEAKEGRLNFLKTRVAMSEVNLEIYQKVIYKESPTLIEKPYIAKVREALGNGWSLITSLSLFIINSWPVLILISMIFWAWRRRRRRLMVEEAI